MNDKNQPENEITDEEREANRILKRVHQESETPLRSSLGRVADDVANHLKATDAEPDQWTEVWGTRIGRILGAIFFVVLVIYLVKTYVLKA